MSEIRWGGPGKYNCCTSWTNVSKSIDQQESNEYYLFYILNSAWITRGLQGLGIDRHRLVTVGGVF